MNGGVDVLGPDRRRAGAAQRPASPLGPLLAALALSGSLFLLTAAGMLVLPRGPGVRTEVVVAIWANIAIMLVALGAEARRRPYSLHAMHLLALFLFLGAPAILQYWTGRFAVAGPIQNVRTQVLPATFSVMLWLIGYLIAYELDQNYGSRRMGPILRFMDRPVTPLRAAVVLLLAMLVTAYLGLAGLAGVATRGAAEADIFEFVQQSGSGVYTLAVYLIHHMLLRAFSLVALLAAILVAMRDRRNRHPLFMLLLGVVTVGTLVANNPFAAARMWLATFVIAFVAPLLLRRMKTGWALVLIAFGGITLLPALHETRYLERIGDWGGYLQLVSPFDYLSRNSDVDSLGMLALCQQWSDRHGHRWGLQMLAAVLFWFPRAIWTNKPIETGGMVTEDLGFEFTNLAPPVMSEVLVDFGLPGIPVVAAVFGYILSRLDRAYWLMAPADRRVRVLEAIYPFWMGCVLFVTRGGSLASFSFTTAFTVWVLPLALGAAQTVRARSRTQSSAAAEASGSTTPR